MLIASLSLAAIPFMTGFYSKDFILESAYGQYNLSSITVYFIATIGAVFTTLYSVIVLYLTFLINLSFNIQYTNNLLSYIFFIKTHENLNLHLNVVRLYNHYDQQKDKHNHHQKI